MQVAEILSDITSLRVCVRAILILSPRRYVRGLPCPTLDELGKSRIRTRQVQAFMSYTDINQGHNEALALVNVNKTIAGTDSSDKGGASTESATTDADKAQPVKMENLRWAKELVQLHYEVKSRHANGQIDEELRQAREGVERVLAELA